MALSSIALCSRALLKIGGETITSFDEGTAEAEITANLYPFIRDGILSAHPWNFATGQAVLARLTAEPVADYSYAYQLPSDLLRVISAGSDGRGRGIGYRIAEGRLHTDSDEAVLTYIFRPAEEDFPHFFDLALISRLASEFCIPLTGSTSRAEVLGRIADTELRRAKLIDAQQETPNRIEDFTLITARN